MSKKVRIIIIVICVILLSVLAFLLFIRNRNHSSTTPPNQSSQNSSATSTNISSSQSSSGSSNNSTNQNTDANSTSSQTQSLPKFSTPDKTAPRMTVNTTHGSVETNNLFQSPVKIFAPDSSLTEVLVAKNTYFSISFFPQDQSFLIVLLNSNLATARTEAETAFLQKTGITKDQACTLNVNLGVPYSINPQTINVNYGLSFCPNGKQL